MSNEDEGRLTAFATGGRAAVGLNALGRPHRKVAAITGSHPSADNAYLLMSLDGSRAYVASGHHLEVRELTVESE